VGGGGKKHVQSTNLLKKTEKKLKIITLSWVGGGVVYQLGGLYFHRGGVKISLLSTSTGYMMAKILVDMQYDHTPVCICISRKCLTFISYIFVHIFNLGAH